MLTLTQGEQRLWPDSAYGVIHVPPQRLTTCLQIASGNKDHPWQPNMMEMRHLYKTRSKLVSLASVILCAFCIN